MKRKLSTKGRIQYKRAKRAAGWSSSWKISNQPKFARTELKYLDVASTGAFTTAGGLVLLNGVATGTDFNNRIGRRIAIKSLEVSLQHAPVTMTTDYVTENLRIMIIHDSDVNGIAPTVATILGNPTEFRNLNYEGRYKVLADIRVCAAYRATQGIASNAVQVHQRYIPLHGEVTWFQGTGAAITDIQSGGLYCLLVGSTGTQFGYALNTRIRYTDS